MSKLVKNSFIIFGLAVVIGLGWWIFVGIGTQNTTTYSTASENSRGDKSISSFVFSDLKPEVNGVITEDNHTVTLAVPYGTDLTNLTPKIEVSSGAIISPTSGTAKDFTNTVIYRVTGPDTTHQEYTVNVVEASKPAPGIINFTVPGQIGSTFVNQDNYAISLTVASGTDLTQLSPTIKLVNGATVTPASGDSQDFTHSVKYAVTLADDSEQNYTVTINVAAATPTSIPLPSPTPNL